MAYEPGGYADKLGNRYERRWVVKQLLRMLNEEIHSVRVEAIGDDERGVDLIVERNDGIKQYQQCKARNGSKESWSVADLNIRGILKNIQFQLERDPNHEFALVTGIPATVIGDICESSRNSNGNPEEFYEYQIKKVGEARRKAFKQFCEYLNLDSQQRDGREAAFNYLRRMYITLWPDDQNCYDGLLSWAGMLVAGKPEVVVASLAEFAQNNLRKTLLADTVRKHLVDSGFNFRKLEHDERVVPAVEKLRRRFKHSIYPGLVAGELIERDETQEILQALDESGLVIIHGAAGYGKSGVLYELTHILKKQGRAYLPVRLDRQEPRDTARQFGLDMGLPESPVICLKSLLGKKSGVLILDQLDALRWTSAHSANSLDVCKAMVREVQNFYNMGEPISVVLACRTFDLEHDPEIKNWLENQKSPGEQHRKIEVKGLPEKTMQVVIEKAGGDFSRLTERQKLILASPQHLAMWVKLKQDGNTPDFQSATQLMREFWKNCYQELEKNGVTATEANVVLDVLVNHMEQQGKISAPESLISDQQKTSTELQTHGIIRIDNRKVSFCHQSYLDFRIADRLLREINQGQGSIRTWLGQKEKQSLFRREQLRQVLLLLCDESPVEFLKNIKELLVDDEVRFHLKHLILELIGQIEQPSRSLCDYLLELANNDYWEPHVHETVFVGHPQYVQLLINSGLAGKGLDCGEEEKRNLTRWLLRSVSKDVPDQVSEFLEPYIQQGNDWPQLVLNTLCWNVEDDSDRMFELRLKLARMGYVGNYVYWIKLGQRYPIRAIQLIEAAISTWDTPRMEDNALSSRQQRSRLEHWNPEELQALKNAVRNNPIRTWDMLIPHVERLTAIEIKEYDNRLNDWQDGGMYSLREGEADLPRGIVLLVCEAGKEMAKNQPDEFMRRTRELNNSISPITKEILITSYPALPPQFSDEVIQWLIADSTQLAIGFGYREPEWMPAARLIEAMSPHCSEELFRQLEYAIIHYHSPGERELAEYYVTRWREGYSTNYWGRAQHFLLPALCQDRRSKTTEGLIGVLKRKFENYPKDHFWRGGDIGRVRSVVSPLSSDKLHKISDKAWLAIINNKEISEKKHLKHKIIGPDQVADSSIRSFSGSLQTIANRYPQRFANLALQFPNNVHPQYLDAILGGVKATKPKEIPDDEKTAWEPAKIEAIEAILEKFPLGNTCGVANEYCRLIKGRSDENWSDRAINRLVEYAKSHPDPKIDKLNTYSTDKGNAVKNASVHTLLNNAINCVRGVAASAIGSLLWKHPEWLEKLRPGIESLIRDSHPAVQVAALETCLPILNIDRDLAVEWFILACKDDLRVAASHHAVQYFNCCIESHQDKLSPIIFQMLKSDYAEVAERGANEVCARWLFFGMFEKELKECRNGRVAHRKGVAAIASQFLDNEKDTHKCRELLLPLLDDRESDVRQKARVVFHDNDKLLKVQGILDFVQKYIQTQAFRDDPTGLLFTIGHYQDSLLPYSNVVFNMCEVFVGPLADSSRDLSTGLAHDASKIPPLILRLYEQAQEDQQEIRDQCLDKWDSMFESRVGETRELMKHIEH